jgi:hypothetical protein
VRTVVPARRKRAHLATLFFDTSICIDRGKGRYSDSDWSLVWKFVTRNFNYAICPLVLTELLIGIARGPEEHFENNRRALKVLYPTHPKRLLTPPGTFAIETILRRRVGGFLREADFKEQIKVVLHAHNKASLVAGRVMFPNDPERRHGFNCELLLRQNAEGQGDHIQSFEDLRDGKLSVPPSPAEWARQWMASLGFVATPEECSRVAKELDAAYRYQCVLWEFATTGDYKFSNHPTDWIDSQLPYYLADPTMHLLVSDRILRQRIADSPQSNRVFSFADFIDLARRETAPRSTLAASR